MDTGIRSLVLIATAMASFTHGADALAQAGTVQRNICQTISTNGIEQLGEGRGLQVTNISCRVEGGPMNGGVLTGSQIYGFEGLNGRMITGSGVVRMPGATLVYENTEATTAVTMADGKVTGWSSAGKGVYKAGFGSAIASYIGKTYSFGVKPTGPFSFVIEVTND